MTTTDYISSISLLPTVDFLEYIAKKQWETEASYGVGFSTIPPLFYSTTNSEWLCLNSESEFLESPQGTATIKNPFSYTRPESSPVLVSFNDLSIPSNKIVKAKSLFLFRIGDNGNEVISVSNYDKNPDNTTTAPPLDCFSRECLSWFGSDVDWYIGVSSSSDSLSELIVDRDGIVLNKSQDILDTLVMSSPIPSTSIELSSTPNTSVTYCTINFNSGVRYNGQSINNLFLYSIAGDDSLVGFITEFETGRTSVDYSFFEIEISFSSEIVII